MAIVRSTFYRLHERQDGTVQLAIPQGRGAVGLDKFDTSGGAGTLQDGASEWTAPSAGYLEIQSDGAAWARVTTAGSDAAVGDAIYLPAAQTKHIGLLEGDKVSIVGDS